MVQLLPTLISDRVGDAYSGWAAGGEEHAWTSGWGPEIWDAATAWNPAEKLRMLIHCVAVPPDILALDAASNSLKVLKIVARIGTGHQ